MDDYPVEIPELPTEQAISRLVSLLEPYRRITQPKFYGIDNMPGDGSLLVGNHTIYGFLDLPFMMAEVWKRRRIAIRGLGEHAHYAVPVWRDLLGACGMVRGTRANVRALMRDHQTILVYPGGAREVNKRRGQQYQLLWGERMGFARLAIEQGYPIVPVAAVGADDMLDVIVDQTTPLYGQLAAAYEKVMGFPTPPVVRGVGLTGIPRPERLYFWFGDPVDTTRFARHNDDAAARESGTCCLARPPRSGRPAADRPLGGSQLHHYLAAAGRRVPVPAADAGRPGDIGVRWRKKQGCWRRRARAAVWFTSWRGLAAVGAAGCPAMPRAR